MTYNGHTNNKDATAREGRKEWMEMKKQYQVFYWIKKNGKEYLNHMYVMADNAKGACKICKEQVKSQTGRNAFRPTTKAPDPETLESLKGNPNFVV